VAQTTLKVYHQVVTISPVLKPVFITLHYLSDSINILRLPDWKLILYTFHKAPTAPATPAVLPNPSPEGEVGAETSVNYFSIIY
jgi:hypothetical protein